MSHRLVLLGNGGILIGKMVGEGKTSEVAWVGRYPIWSSNMKFEMLHFFN